MTGKDVRTTRHHGAGVAAHALVPSKKAGNQ